MRWKKLGRIFCPEKRFPWMVSHAAHPTAEPLGNGFFRVYFSPRDARNRSSIASLDIHISKPLKILHLSTKPLLTPGPRGSFDDSGVSMGCLQRVGSKKFLYYIGWNLGVTVPWRNSIGLAVAGKGGCFEKFSGAPVLDRSAENPYSLSLPFVAGHGQGYRMWYGSNRFWGEHEKEARYELRVAESPDGIRWRRLAGTALRLKKRGECAVARPSVLKEGGRHRMWYCFRGAQYRIGYAESEDGLRWTRRDEKAGLTVSASGWDSRAVAYPHVFAHEGSKYMLYNGNGYGRTGFGIARGVDS